ncbi:hypothetical protein BCR39DRAFT_556311 [Naematelia encephala]|uniref:Uncharacterized protein n=1 Tax=Naematelia encephala TaxID=71784 RepID=A0A1Y2BJ63_9TREE|nr:hypothetical protein BCR39DRAFT_556311 [Naematelia encephala]
MVNAKDPPPPPPHHPLTSTSTPTLTSTSKSTPTTTNMSSPAMSGYSPPLEESLPSRTVSPPSRRRHSSSISSVRFADLPHRTSMNSLRSTNPPAARAPQRPSLDVHSSHVSLDGATSLRSSRVSFDGATPKEIDPVNPRSNGNSQHPPPRQVASFESPFRRGQDRPVRPLIQHGRRATLVTGGYETSSDDTSSDDTPPRQAINLPSSPSYGPSRTFPRLATSSKLDHGRTRAQTLAFPPEDTSRTGTPNADISGTSDTGFERLRKVPKRLEQLDGQIPRSASLRSPSLPPTAHPHSRSFSQRSSRSQAFPRSESNAIPGPSRLRSETSSRAPSAVKIPEERPASSPDSRKGKERERPRGLAASLGLDGGFKDAALSPGASQLYVLALMSEQIHNLLADSDVATAMRLMSSHLTPRPSIPDASALSPPPTRSNTPAPPQHAEPFIVSAPPPLTGESHIRERTDSVASTIAHVNWDSSPKRASWDSDMNDKQVAKPRRSDSIAAPEAGHIPFTHHVPVVEVESESDQEEPEPLPSAPVSNGMSKSASTGKLKEGNRSRLSQLFHLKRKPSPDLLPRTNTQHVHPTTPLRNVISHAPGHEVHKTDHHKDRQQIEREALMRRKEQERRDAEIAQERRYRALTQVAAHPESERHAFHASSHFRAYYNHIYDGIENPPRMNPLAVLRWKHRVEEQTEAKARWEEQHKSPHAGSWTRNGAVHDSPVSADSSRFRQSGESTRPTSLGSSRHEPIRRKGHGWRYTMEDVAAYKACDGAINYFIPPREERSAPSISSDRAASSRPESTTSKKSTPAKMRITSASMISLYDDTTAEPSLDLSRTASVETGGRAHRLTHRTHHSLSSMAPHHPMARLKVPFEKIGSVAKKRTHGDDLVEEQSVQQAPSVKSTVTPNRNGRDNNPRPPRDFALFRRDQGLTDEEHQSHLRKLFVKGQRGIDVQPPRLPTQATQDDRRLELQALERALARETSFRERQDEENRKTQLEVEAKDRIYQVEAEIYAERTHRVGMAAKRLEQFNMGLSHLDETMSHFLAQADHLALAAKVTAEAESTWPNLDSIRAVYRSDVFQEPHDIGQRRKSLIPRLQDFSVKPWPRRTSLDPSGTRQVNPITRVELTIEHAKSRRSDMNRYRAETTRDLQRMIRQIDGLMRQKDAVRAWAKTARERHRNLQLSVDQLQRQLRGNTHVRWGRMTDTLLDTVWRRIASPIFKSFFGVFYVGKWFWSLRHPSTRVGTRPNERGPEMWGWWSILVGLGSIIAFFWWLGA